MTREGLAIKWFKHDADASLDAKLIKLRIKHGMEGYGLYWYCLECIARNVDKNHLTFELEHDSEVISYNTGLHNEKVQEIMQYMIKLKLFESSNGIITCLRMAARLDDTTSRHPQIRAMQETLRSNPEVTTESLRLEQNRIEQNRTEKKKTGRFTPPSLEEVTNYCLQRKNIINPQNFIDHYEANGWVRGKTKIKSWKACVRTWEVRTPKPVDMFDGAI